ncbi:MAG: FAD-binding protein, partial [Deltaproteobacteria bacterium]
MKISLVRKDPQYVEGVEKSPRLDKHFQSDVRGLHVVGAAAGSPLLKTCINQGVEVMRAIARLEKPSGAVPGPDGPYDVVIVGAGPAGISAAMEAAKRGFSYVVLEKLRPFDTVHNFPEGKHVYAEPASMAVLGELWLEDSTKEQLLERWGAALSKLRLVTGAEVKKIAREGKHLSVELSSGRTVKAKRVVLAIGRMGNPRRLGVEGEDLPWVSYRLLNPAKVSGKRVVVFGGGNSAAEAALALLDRNEVTLVHRGADFPRLSKENRARLEKAEKEGRIRIVRQGRARAFRDGKV